jgi:hypothetical protein
LDFHGTAIFAIRNDRVSVIHQFVAAAKKIPVKIVSTTMAVPIKAISKTVSFR